MASAISILDTELQPLLYRVYTFELVAYENLISEFQQLYKHHQQQNTLTPILSGDGVNYLFIRSGDLILMLVCYYDQVNVMELFTFLYKLESIFKSYFKGRLNRGVVMDNFDFVFELFDEVMDYGIPQLTEIGILKDVIKLDVTRPELGGSYEDEKDLDDEEKLKLELIKEVNSSVLRGSTNKVSWRSKGLYYPKNEIFVDLIEYNTLVIHRDLNKIIKNEVRGEVNLKCYLTGMPVIKLQMNEVMKKFDKDAVNLAQFVDLWRYKNDDGVILFIPPDAESTLLSYKVLNFNKRPLVVVKSYKTEVKGDKLIVKGVIRLNVTIKTNFKDLLISFPKPTPPEPNQSISFQTNPKFKTKFGKVLYDFTQDRVIWNIPSFKDSEVNHIEEIEMASQFQLIDTTKPQEKEDLGMNPPPKRLTPSFSQIQSNLKPEDDDDEGDAAKQRDEIRICFQLENQTYTGLKIQYLKIEREYDESKGDVWGEEKMPVIKPEESLDIKDGENGEIHESGDEVREDGVDENKKDLDEGEKLGYTCFPWIRYMCCSDDEFVYRI